MFHLASVVLMLVDMKIMFTGNYVYNEAHNHIHYMILLGEACARCGYVENLVRKPQENAWENNIKVDLENRGSYSSGSG